MKRITPPPSTGAPAPESTANEHNHLRKLAQLEQAGLLPTSGIIELDVLHDDECGFFRGGRCDCDPRITPHGWPALFSKD
jgi:hypothetical protein